MKKKPKVGDEVETRDTYPWLSSALHERPSFEDVPLGGPYAVEEGGAGRVSVGIVQYRRRLLDDDAAVGGSKGLLDALCYSGAIQDDAKKFIRLQVRQVKVKTEEEEGTAVILDYPEGYDMNLIGKAKWEEKK